MKKVIFLLMSICFVSFAEQLDPYGACLTKANKSFLKKIDECENLFYKKMILKEKENPEIAESYAKLFEACVLRAKAKYDIDKTRCEVLYRE